MQFSIHYFGNWILQLVTPTARVTKRDRTTESLVTLEEQINFKIVTGTKSESPSKCLFGDQ